jgi:CDP-6-deoxy-D-xylo-4-hexulose-3-dehydrase
MSTQQGRVFITGGSGLVGGQCAIAFRAAGWEVVATHCSYPTPSTVSYDCANPTSTDFDVHSFGPNVIVHCAALTNVDECEKSPEASKIQNVTATQNVAALAKACGAQLVYMSTDYVFDGAAGPYSEDAVPSPRSVYGQHKLDSEAIALAASTSIVLRITNVYGEEPRGKNFVARIAANAQKSVNGEPMTLKLPSDQIATPVEAADVAAVALMLVTDGNKSGVYHVGGSEYVSRVQLAAMILSHVPGHNATIAPTPTSALNQAALRPLKGGLVSLRLQAEYPLFTFGTIGSFLAEAKKKAAQQPKPLPGMYSQYDKPGKHWYAPNKFEAYGEEEIAAVEKCLRDGFLAPGPRTDQFAASVASLFAKKCALMVNSGSSANLIALNAFGFKPGDEVVTAACTFSTVIAPLVQLGVKPIFVDVVRETYVPSTDIVINAITPKTVMIWLPNLIGSKPDWAEIRRRAPKGMALYEDACDTIDETPQSDVSITSFYASHMITAGGGGGMIMANDEAFIDKCRMYRDWGRIGNNSEDLTDRFGSSVDGIPYDGKFLYGVIGYNMKSTEMNAAFGNVQLTKLPRFRKIRRANFERFLNNLSGTSYGLPAEPHGFVCHWMAFPLLSKHRNKILKWLESNNIQTRVTFAGNNLRPPPYRSNTEYYGTQRGGSRFPAADAIMAEGFLLGCHHGTTFAQIDRACELLKEFEKTHGSQGFE